MIHALIVEDRAENDERVANALASGKAGVPDRRKPAARREEEARYTGSYADPDGNAWQVTRLDQLHVVN